MDISVFNRFHHARILVVGDIMLDRYITGDSQRISPEAPVPIVKINKQENKLGGAANVARNIRYLDAQVGILGVIGNDENGEHISRALTQEGIAAHLITSAKPTNGRRVKTFTAPAHLGRGWSPPTPSRRART